jgi:hypothetical protein
VRNVDDVLEKGIRRDAWTLDGLRADERDWGRQSVPQDRRQGLWIEHQIGVRARALGPAAARHSYRVVARRIVRILDSSGHAARGAWIEIDGDDVRARAANRRHRDQRRANPERRSRATPHFAPPNYGCWAAIISGKNEELVNADHERHENKALGQGG